MKLKTIIKFPATDCAFNRVYPDSIQALAIRHWTPLHVVRLAVDFLTSASSHARILDIGSGAGKFCIAGAHFAPNHHFYGIEQREHIIKEARLAQDKIGISNVSFIHGNFTQLNFSDFDHFYFYNSFYENLNEEGRIDHSIEYSEALYDYYVTYLHNALRAMPIGTRVATFHSMYREIPLNYDLADSLEEGNLNLWIKTKP
ncbi:MAG TPA: methyltransferase domain-containing protein [Flavipsychrobacter sp.]|nr:methyltransferase domain-containing protein [Flavipsychrobacter sp.]